MKPGLRAGIEHEKRFVVPESKLVPALYPESPEFSEMPRVLVTGFLVGLLEWACIEALKPRTRLRFEVQAHDGVELISRGTHERCVIDSVRFDAKIKMKLAA